MGTTTQEVLVFEGPEHARCVLKWIQEAKTEVMVSSYLLNDDSFGRTVTGALSLKARSGVTVRIVVDGFGSWPWVKGHAKSVRSENLQVRVYHPLPWPLSRFVQIYRIGILLDLLLNFNRRNHQKLFVIDRQRAIMGSRNINDDALAWRENSLLLTGKPVLQLAAVFENVWRRSHNRFFQRVLTKSLYDLQTTSPQVFSNHLFALRKRRRKLLGQKIESAQSRVCITTPYFNPGERLLRRLRERSEAGVRVCVLLPKRSDVKLSKWIAEMHYQRYLRMGIRIFEYKPSVLHAKSILIDDWALVGSSNMNRRSALRDLEIDYAISSPGPLDDLQQQFEKDLAESDEVLVAPQMNPLQRAIAVLVTWIFPSWL